ncbi:PA0069 family radical SAM protein [Saccharospirillum salsuginis]|uniref:Radical SAM protein n=1 Tax=Saccharospirillum salsuginis TaxID=418750 RepID=A0A918KHK3_9GAMM|nr:PA0069 family radical SAM protein [Saccharospirillum salsuginis]GGX64163.1 radical SAM protein [Saccharospirillum salsuginis]
MRTRGTPKNPHNRFQHRVTDRAVDDGWYRDPEDECNPDSLATEVVSEQAKTIISTNQSPDVPFDQSINPYRGCEHGCVYCFARPSHAYWDYSPGLDFETKLIAKTNANERLLEALDKPSYVCKPIALGINTDAYQPLEKHQRITRQLLETLLDCRHPVSVITKGGLILRDLDLLSELARQGLCTVRVSLTTLDNDLKRKMEPRTASPGTRLKVIRRLSEAGVPVGIIMGPVIPFVNDAEIESLLEAAFEAGAQRATWILLRLPLEISELFEDWLQRHYPDRAEHVMNRIRDMRGGKVYDSTFGKRMSGEGLYTDMIRQRFDKQCRKLGLNSHDEPPLRTDLFRRPSGQQIDLF